MMKHHSSVETAADPAIDLIRTEIPPDKADWTENLCWTLHDPHSGFA